jgi:large subunit ribosomal protein L25
VLDGGGVLQESLHELSVECLPKDIPQAIDIDVAHLQVGDSIHVSDIKLDNVTILNDPGLVICVVTMPTAAALPEPTEGEAGAELEPEVIRERRGEDEG